MRYSQKGKDVRRICCLHHKVSVRGFIYFGERESMDIIIASSKLSLHHAVCQHEIGRKVILLPTHHAATLLIATRIHSMTFQRLLSIGRRIILLGVFQG